MSKFKSKSKSKAATAANSEAKFKTNSMMIEDYTSKPEPGFMARLKTSAIRIRLLMGLIMKRVPTFIPIILVSALVHTAQIAIAVFIPKFFLDAVSSAMPWPEALRWILLAAVAEGGLRFAQNRLNTEVEVLQLRADNEIGLAISEKITNLPYSDLENPAILTMKEEASFVLTNQGAAYRFVQLCRDVAQQVVTILTLLAILSQLSFLIILVILIIVTLITMLQNSIKRYETTFYKNIVGVNRKYGYFLNQAFSQEQQPSIRLYRLDKMLSLHIDKMNLELIDYMSAYLDRQGKISGLQSVLMDLQAAIAYGYAALRVVTDIAGPRISIGSFSLYAGTAIQFTGNLRGVLTSFRDIQQIIDMLEPFENFMKLEERVVAQSDLPMKPIETIEFEHVHFTYPGTDNPVLKDVSFKIEKGSKTSIVGLNGAGKTTLIKLLCRFFKPDSGRILINNTDITDLPESAYLAEVSAVFQDFRLLPFSIKSNIGSQADEDIDTNDLARIQAIADETSVSTVAATLSEGLDTKLNKSINQGGTELSGGQAQKVAIARALYKQASLVILDEPTSALDPLAEAEIYEHFDTLVRGQTAIYISHRMSSSRFCDRVLVLDGGEVVAYAHHDELVQDENSLYTLLFNEQKQYYSMT